MPHRARAAGMAVLLAGLAALACSAPPFTWSAAGPFAYPSDVPPPFERVAILVTITNRSGDDLDVNPADFVARDAAHRIYPSDPTAAAGDAQAVRVAYATRRDVQAIAPLPMVTLRQDDVLSGFVVFDVPAGVRPVELVWRQSDTDYVVPLAAAR
jgi:hypothetical protein